jgi:hypothetical protein
LRALNADTIESACDVHCAPSISTMPPCGTNGVPKATMTARTADPSPPAGVRRLNIDRLLERQ